MIRSLPQGRALITAASSAISLIYAHRLSSRGFDLVLATDAPGSLEGVGNWLGTRTGSLIETIELDSSDEANTSPLEQRIARDPELRMLVNNGMVDFNPSTPRGAIDALISNNASSVARLTYAAAAAFAGRGGGTIINIGPLASQPRPRRTYAASDSRAFLRSLGQALDSELRPNGVRVQTVLPVASLAPFWEVLVRGRVENLPTEVILVAEDLVDQAIVGLHNGEVISSPRLADPEIARGLAHDPRPALHEVRG